MELFTKHKKKIIATIAGGVLFLAAYFGLDIDPSADLTGTIAKLCAGIE